MSNKILVGLTILVAAVSFSACRPAVALQQGRCHVQDEWSARLLTHATEVATATDAQNVAYRADRQLLAVPASSVSYVTDEAICTTIATIIDNALPPAERNPARAVYVVRIGTRYLAEDPTVEMGEFTLSLTLDENLNVLTRHLI